MLTVHHSELVDFRLLDILMQQVNKMTLFGKLLNDV